MYNLPMILPDLKEEQKLWEKGYQFVAGVDEVGRGAWAGPLVAAVVIFPPDISVPKELRDSKQLSPALRRQIADWIKKDAISHAIAYSVTSFINKHGIVAATQKAFRAALKKLSPDFILVDAFHVRYLPKKKQKAIIKGDQKVVSIAAASILAKVYRDKLMAGKYHRLYPRYRFCSHKGYGTPEHQEAIARFGLCPIHRVNFIPQMLYLTT